MAFSLPFLAPSLIPHTIFKIKIQTCFCLLTSLAASHRQRACFSLCRSLDESADISDKEQLSVCLRYIRKSGEVVERFLGIVHVPNTTSLTLKNAIESLLMEHSLTLSRVRGQGYDGASNMKGAIGGLKTLIMNECPSAHYVHCFAHQLQLTLVAVAKKIMIVVGYLMKFFPFY